MKIKPGWPGKAGCGLVLLQLLASLFSSSLAMEPIAVYEGPGAVLARDVKKVLEKLPHGFRGVGDPAALEKSSEEGPRVFIVPGGFTRDIQAGWGSEGRKKIRDFVARGGTYIGICAGAYLAAGTVEVEGKPRGLGIIPVKNERKSGLEIRKIRILDKEDPLVRNCPQVMKIWYQNGPLMEAGEGCITVAEYENGAGAIVRGRFGKGKVILFSPHPEGSGEFGVDGEKLGSLVLLKNALRWILGNHQKAQD